MKPSYFVCADEPLVTVGTRVFVFFDSYSWPGTCIALRSGSAKISEFHFEGGRPCDVRAYYHIAKADLYFPGKDCTGDPLLPFDGKDRKRLYYHDQGSKPLVGTSPSPRQFEPTSIYRAGQDRCHNLERLLSVREKDQTNYYTGVFSFEGRTYVTGRRARVLDDANADPQTSALWIRATDLGAHAVGDDEVYLTSNVKASEPSNIRLRSYSSTGRRYISTSNTGFVRPKNLTTFDGTLYFTMTQDGGGYSRLFYVDSSYNVVKVDDSQNADRLKDPYALQVLGEDLYFIANDKNETRRLWRMGGAGAAPTMLGTEGDATTPSNPSAPTYYDGKIYFRAESQGYGAELWGYSPGNPPFLVDELATNASSAPHSLQVYDGELVFTAYDGQKRRIWTYDGSSDPTQLISCDSSPSCRDLVVAHGSLYFTVRHVRDHRRLEEVRKYDGQGGGTYIPGTHGFDRFQVAGDHLFFWWHERRSSRRYELRRIHPHGTTSEYQSLRKVWHPHRAIEQVNGATYVFLNQSLYRLYTPTAAEDRMGHFTLPGEGYTVGEPVSGAPAVTPGETKLTKE